MLVVCDNGGREERKRDSESKKKKVRERVRDGEDDSRRQSGKCES